MSLSTQSNLWLCNWWPSLACFEVTLLWKLKILTKQVNAPWHEGERLQSDQLASWRQTSQTVLRIETVCFKKFAQGIALYWILERGMAIWLQYCHVMSFIEGVPSGTAVSLSWKGCVWTARNMSFVKDHQMIQERGGFQNSTQRQYALSHCHTFSPELVHAGTLPIPSNRVWFGVHCNAYFYQHFLARKIKRTFF